MDKLLEKIGLYDFFVRLITGLTIFVCADYFGITKIINKKVFKIPAVILGGYLLGIVLEELLFLISCMFKFKKAKTSFAKYKSNDKFEKSKTELIGAGYEYLIESPQINYVSAGSYSIAFFIMTLIYLLKPSWLPDSFPKNNAYFTNLIILIAMMIIFLFRYFHYLAYRNKLIERYHKSYIKNKQTDHNDNDKV